jgi:hypothetical protein
MNAISTLHIWACKFHFELSIVEIHTPRLNIAASSLMPYYSTLNHILHNKIVFMTVYDATKPFQLLINDIHFNNQILYLLRSLQLVDWSSFVLFQASWSCRSWRGFCRVLFMDLGLPRANRQLLRLCDLQDQLNSIRPLGLPWFGVVAATNVIKINETTGNHGFGKSEIKVSGKFDY